MKRLASKVLLVGWDAADWKFITPLLEAGQLPTLEGLVNRGVMGNLATLTPMLSPLLWTSIATGQRADRHGVLGFVGPGPGGVGVRTASSTSRQVKALWNILSQAGLRTHVVNWFASHPAEPINGVCVSDLYPKATAAHGVPWPLPPGAVHPPRLEETLAQLRLHPGDLDGAHLLPFVPEAARIDQATDRHLLLLAESLAECVSTHAAATWVMEHEPWDFLAVYYDAIDHLGHHFMPYHPPRLEGVAERDFELYKEVMVGVYRFHDMMLARLLELAGPDTTVLLVSDHGFHSDERRPRGPGRFALESAAAWHRPLGVMCLAGPGVKEDELIHGAGLLDITPTVLTLFGLPVGDDMVGRPLMAAFADPVAPDRIPSWEAVPGECGMHPPDREDDPWEAREALAQLAALGYVDAPPDDEQRLLRVARLHRTFNLARVLLDAERPAEAAPLFEELVREEPGEATYALFLAQCRFALGQRDECRRLVTAVLEGEKDRPAAELLLGLLCLSEERTEEALAHLLRAEQTVRPSAELSCQVGSVYLREQRWPDAERSYRQALAQDDEAARAHYGLARALLGQGRLEEAADAALTAVGLSHHMPLAHCVLGIALARLGRVERARQALETCLAQRPRTATAHDWLAAIHDQATGDKARADEHRRRAAEIFPRPAGELAVAGVN